MLTLTASVSQHISVLTSLYPLFLSSVYTPRPILTTQPTAKPSSLAKSKTEDYVDEQIKYGGGGGRGRGRVPSSTVSTSGSEALLLTLLILTSIPPPHTSSIPHHDPATRGPQEENSDHWYKGWLPSESERSLDVKQHLKKFNEDFQVLH